MPVQYDLPEYQNASSIEDVNKYNKLPFYLASLEAKYFPQWQVFNTLFGKITWTPHMGKVMRGVRAEPTPVVRQTFFPVELDHQPNKDVFENYESSEDITLKWHDFDSKLMNFLPSFQDFRENQIDFTHKDIVRQISIISDIFTRSVMLNKTPYIAIAGATPSSMLQAAPFVPSGTSVDATSVAAQGKSTAYLQAKVAEVKGGLTLAAIDYLVCVLRDDLGAPFFEGTVNTPNDNDLIKGKYVLVTSSEAYQQFKWDPNFAQFRDVTLNIVTDGFHGSIFNLVTTKIERYPLRLMANGTLPEPETYDVDSKRTQPNPDYVNAPFEIAWLVGAESFKTIKVGPPPKEFVNKQMSVAKFYSMRWNGEVQLTDQILIVNADGSYSTNVRGRFVQLISSVIYGCIPVTARHCLPIMFERVRPGTVTV